MEATQKKNKYEIDMCNGTIMDKLISFALPLMVSSILQLLFNAVDIIVVGRFTGSQALAAVGSTTALINMFVNLFIGVSLGANVLSARFYAAGKEDIRAENARLRQHDMRRITRLTPRMKELLENAYQDACHGIRRAVLHPGSVGTDGYPGGCY